MPIPSPWVVSGVEATLEGRRMSPDSLASLGARSRRTVGHGRQPASRVLLSAPALRVTAAADRAGSPCGPAGRLALDSLPASATPASRSVVAEHHRLLAGGPRTSSRPRAVGRRARAREPAHVAGVSARCGSKRVPARSIAQATLSKRSATERRARACPWPRARSDRYLSWLTGSRWAATRAQW